MASAPEKKSQPLSISTGNIISGGMSGSGTGMLSSSVCGDVINNSELDAIHNELLTTSINSNLMSTSQISTTSIGEKSNLSITHHATGVSSLNNHTHLVIKINFIILFSL